MEQARRSAYNIVIIVLLSLVLAGAVAFFVGMASDILH
jgi:hypothetical protein